MSNFGAVGIIREMLDIEEGLQEEKISRFKALSNVWLDEFAPSDIMNDLDTVVKDMAVNLHTVYLFSLSAGRFSEETPKVALELRDEGVHLLERAIDNDMKSFVIRKVNK